MLEEAETNHLVACSLTELAHTSAFPLCFASFDKANRSDHRSYRGPGLEEGLASLDALKTEFGFPVVTDVHEPSSRAGRRGCGYGLVPAFLSRQTDLLHRLVSANLPVLLKKMQMMSPSALYARRKLLGSALPMSSSVNEVRVSVTRTWFGLSAFVEAAGGTDYRCITWLTNTRLRDMKRVDEASMSHLWHAAISLGVGGIFIEVILPEDARCDGPCALPLTDFLDS